MSDADRMRAENALAFNSMFEAMRQANLLIQPTAAECEAYAKKHFGPDCRMQGFETPPNQLTIGNPHHNDELDPENQQ